MPAPHELDVTRACAALVDVERRLTELPWTEVRRLDQELRSRSWWSSPTWFLDWNRLAAGHVWLLGERSGRPFAAAALLSMHGSGYVRQAAVEEMSRLDDRRTFPFLAIRTLDWVDEVRTPATAAARVAFRRLEDGDRLRALPFLRSLAEVKEHQALVTELLGRLRARTDRDLLVRGLAHADLEVRRACARELALSGQAVDALDAALGQDDPVRARTVGVAALDQADDPADVLERLWASDVADLRAEVLARGHRLGDAHAPERAEAGLFDRSASVRSLAQAQCARAGDDVRSRYLTAIPEKPPAVFGLSEVGGPDDVPLIRSLLVADRPAVRRAAIWALVRLAGDAAQPDLLLALEDPSSAVVGAATRALARQRLSWRDLDALWRRWSPAGAADTDRAALFRITAGQARWPRLVIACRAVVSDDLSLAERGVFLLRAVQHGWNRAQSDPTSDQIAELRRLAPGVRLRVPPAVADELDDVLRHAGA